ncbi:hypothetical protein, partial [Protofrankia coriariae]
MPGHARPLALHRRDGTISRTVPAVELTPGVWLYREGRECWCDSCYRQATAPATCPHATAPWALAATCGLIITVPWYMHDDVLLLRRYATDITTTLTAAGIDLTDPDPARLQVRMRTPTGTAAG